MKENILDNPVLSSRYFFPRKQSFADPFWVDCGDARLGCYYRESHPGAKTVIHFHGNGEIVADYIPDLVSVFDELGYNLFLAEYRGYGMSGGSPQLIKMLGDITSIIQAINRPHEELVLFGRSVGSIYAIHAASLFPDIPGLILESGIASPLERVLLRVAPGELGATMESIEEEAGAHLDHEEKLSRYKGSSLLLHTRHDGLVDVSNAQRLHEWSSEPKKLRIFEQGNHNTILFTNFHEYFDLVQTFIQGLTP